jgi:transcription-repair coupling factor (superfamily II helicase)
MQGEPGSYRPLEPQALYFTKEEWEDVEQNRPIHLASPFPEPESVRVIDFGVQAARDFAPERAQQANVYEAVANHIGELRKSGRKVVLASYTRGARERLGGLLEDHGLKAQKQVDSWQDALGSKTQPALLVLPLDHGFTTPDLAVLTEQDLLGDRLVRRLR